MILPWNRSELAIVFNMEQCNAITDALEQAGIDCHVKARDRSSPGLSMGNRERSGTLFQDHRWLYTIYVLRRDLPAAQAATGLSPIR